MYVFTCCGRASGLVPDPSCSHVKVSLVRDTDILVSFNAISQFYTVFVFELVIEKKLSQFQPDFLFQTFILKGSLFTSCLWSVSLVFLLLIT